MANGTDIRQEPNGARSSARGRELRGIVFAFVGARNPAVGAHHPQHSCYYTIDESVLAKGSMVAAQWACRQLG